MPLLDLLAPAGPALQGLSGDGGGLIAAGAKEIGVAPEALAAGGKGGDGQIPADHHRQLQLRARGQLKAQGHGGAQRIVFAAAPVVVALRHRAIGGKALPDLRSIAMGVPAAAAHQLNALELFWHGDAPLALAFGDGLAQGALHHHPAQAGGIDGAVALALGGANGGHVVVLGAAVIAEVHRRAGVGVAEPASGVAPAQQQRELERLAAGVAETPAEHRHRQGRVAVVARNDRAEALAAGLTAKNAAVLKPAQGIAGAVAAGGLLGSAGRIPAPAAQGRFAFGVRAIDLGRYRQGMGAGIGAVVFKEGELAIGQGAKPVLTAIDVPEVEITFGAAANAAGAKAA